MLEGLQQIDWSSLSHAYGQAGDVPDLIQGLLDSEPQRRHERLSLLYETIWHQGTIYEASAYAVPFLFELLRSPATPDKSMIAMLLADLADGAHPLELYTDPADKMSQLVRKGLENEGRDYEVEVKAGEVWERATRAAVGEGLDALIEYLDDEEPEVRATVAKAFSRFPERAQDFLPRLEAALKSEGEDYVRETLEATLAVLNQRL